MTRPSPIIESPRHDRRDFIRAFHEHLWRAPGTDRPTVRPQTVVTVAVLSALASLVTGIVLHLVHRGSDNATAATAPAVTGPATYTAVSGWDCGATGDHGFEVGGRTADWRTVANGGWRDDGCLGSFESVPTLAKGQDASTPQYALWWFLPGKAFDRCDISVYIPTAGAPEVTASSARYVVLSTGSVTAIGEVTIDQAKARGTWVSAGSYPSGPAGLALRLDNAVGTGNLAFAQVKLQCGQ